VWTLASPSKQPVSPLSLLIRSKEQAKMLLKSTKSWLEWPLLILLAALTKSGSKVFLPVTPMPNIRTKTTTQNKTEKPWTSISARTSANSTQLMAWILWQQSIPSIFLRRLISSGFGILSRSQSAVKSQLWAKVTSTPRSKFFQPTSEDRLNSETSWKPGSFKWKEVIISTKNLKETAFLCLTSRGSCFARIKMPWELEVLLFSQPYLPARSTVLQQSQKKRKRTTEW